MLAVNELREQCIEVEEIDTTESDSVCLMVLSWNDMLDSDREARLFHLISLMLFFPVHLVPPVLNEQLWDVIPLMSTYVCKTDPGR